jgi:hypothetical protein
MAPGLLNDTEGEMTMTRIITTVSTALLLVASAAYGQRATVAAGTTVDVRTNEAIKVNDVADGRNYSAVVEKDVLDPSGNIAIPRGSNAQLTVRKISSSEMAVDLESINVGGRQYTVASDTSTQTAERKEGLGTNKRTGKYVGGGAAVGAVIGAIAGGGKGAAIGAATGAAAGAGAQVLTRGKSVNVPAETVLSFRLNSPLRVREAADRNVTRPVR